MLDQTLNSLRLYLSQLQGANACLASHQACNFDKSLTPASLGFFVFTLVFFAFSFVLFVKKTKHTVFSVLAVALGVLIFELFTAPMWDSLHMGRFGYIYLDVSWIFTIAWTAAFLTTFSIIDTVFRHLKERVRFFLYLIPMTLYTIALEVFLVAGGIRTYAPEVLEVSLGSFLGVPVEVFYYAPVFSCLIIAFAKFWEHIHKKRPFLPSKRRFSLRNAFILFLAVFAYELLVEPMVQNRGFPTWTYVYQDITAVRVLLWMLVIWVGAEFVDFALRRIRISYFLRFTGYISISTLVLFQIESWFLQHGFREYSQSAALNFSGFVTPISEIPIEVAFAIPLYLILVVSFLGYWRMTLDYDL